MASQKHWTYCSIQLISYEQKLDVFAYHSKGKVDHAKERSKYKRKTHPQETLGTPCASHFLSSAVSPCDQLI